MNFDTQNLGLAKRIGISKYVQKINNNNPQSLPHRAVFSCIFFRQLPLRPEIDVL